MSELLASWNAKGDRAARNVMAIGASNVVGFGVTETQAWMGRLRDFYSRWPSRGRGFRNLIAYGTTEWVQTGSFTRVDNTTADDHGPFGYQYRLSGSGNSWRYKVLSGETVRAVVYCDAAGSGDWSWSLDGAAYASAGAATAHDHAIKLALLPSAPASTLDIRGANAAGTTAQVDLLGIISETASGLVRWDNVAISGHRLTGPYDGIASGLYHTSVGDSLALIDLLDPDLLIVTDYYNDLTNLTADSTYLTAGTFASGLNAIIDRAQAAGASIICILYPETNNTDANHSFANQDLIRSIVASTAAAQGADTVDLYTAFGGSLAAGIANGYFQADHLHWSTTGHDLAAQMLWRLMAQTGAAFLRA